MSTIASYDWNRYWCLREGSMMLGRGYLFVFPDFSKDVVTFDKISQIPCLALLGEPGIGKSHALQTEIANLKRGFATKTDEDVLFFNLRSYSSDTHLVQDIFQSSRFNEWLSGSYTLHLFLDSLDEGLLRIDTLTALLVDKLRNLPIDRLSFRVACRTAEWSSFLEAQLKQLWGEESFKAYELAPLQITDVSTAAKTEGLDPSAFLSEVESKGAEPLAAKPITLKLLLNLFRLNSALPRSQAELYERGCLLLCEEESERRKTKWTLTARQRFRVAARAAAITILANKASIWIANDTGEQTESDVTISEIAGGFELDTDGVDFHVTEDVVRETLYATGLFTSRGLNRLGWQHQTYAEFLAAWYLDYLKLEDDAVLHVLKNSDDAEGLLVPQLYETAAWVASKRVGIFHALMQTEPLVLLRSDVLSADDEVRAALTSALLTVFDEEKEFDRWEIRSYYSKLKHATLAEQLRPYLTDKSKGFLVRRVAMDIAEECDVKALQNDLADIALDQKEQPATRSSAASAVREIGDSQTRARLKPLALGEAGEDPESELKGYGLMCVWPEHMTATELFKVLTDDPNLYGSYKSFLNRKLISGLKTEDLPVALEWVGNVTRDSGAFDFDRKAVSSEILVKAWEALDDERVLNAFVEVVIQKLRRYDELLEEYDAKDTLLAMRQDTKRRRRLLLRVFPLLNERTDWFGLGHSIVLRLGNMDVPWLLEEFLANKDIRIRDVLVSILRDFLNSWDGVAPEVLTEIHDAIDQSELLRHELSTFFEPITLDSAKAREAREAYEKAFAWRKSETTEEKEEPLTPSPPDRVLMMLDKFEQGNVDAWWQLNLEMTLAIGSKFYGNELEVDLRRLPGWTEATEETRHRITAAAKEYVLIGNPKTEEWIGTNTLYRPAFSGYRALWLLRALDRSFTNSLSSEVWRKWAPIVFHYPIYNGSGDEVYGAHRQFIGSVYRAVPDEIIQLLLAEIDRFGAPNSNVDFEKLQECWDERLLTALRQKLADTDLNPQMFSRILTALVEHRDGETVSYAHQLLNLPIPNGEAEQERAMVAATSLLLYGEDAGWESVWPAISTNSEFGRRVIESVLSPYRRQIIAQLPEAKIGDFYVWLSRQYPHSDDPQFPAGVAHFVGTREEIAQLRDSLLSHLKERGTRESVQTIDKIAEELPHLKWLKWTLLEAKKSMRRHSWKPLSPSEIIGLREALELLMSKKRKVNAAFAPGTSSSLTLWGRKLDEIPNLDDFLASFTSSGNRFTFFVGAGLSVPVFPMWDELLLRMINKCDGKKVISSTDKNELLASLSQRKDFLDIASTCVEALPKHEYRAFLEEQFDHDIDITRLSTYQELFKLRPKTIVTTNFDRIPETLNGSSFSLDETAKSSDSVHYRVFTNRNVTEANNAWKSGKPIIFKMHGCVTDQNSIVFTREDFRREIYLGSVKEFLKAIFSSETVLFLGFGFSDPHIDSILSFLYEVNSGLGSPHYVLTHDLSNIQKHTLERNYGVRVINYVSTAGHPQVADFIRFIRDVVA
jgi:predicted NACHT family NTPase